MKISVKDCVMVLVIALGVTILAILYSVASVLVALSNKEANLKKRLDSDFWKVVDDELQTKLASIDDITEERKVLGRMIKEYNEYESAIKGRWFLARIFSPSDNEIIQKYALLKERITQKRNHIDREFERISEWEARSWILDGKTGQKQAVVFALEFNFDSSKIEEINSMSNETLNLRLKSFPREKMLGAKNDIERINFSWSFPPPSFHDFQPSQQNVVVCGPTGAGKSTSLKYILKALNFPKRVWKSVRTGITETTKKARKFEWNNVAIWDIPGYGSTGIPKGIGGKEYIRNWGLFWFDLTIIICKDRVRDFEVKLSELLSKHGRKFVVVRTNMDGVVTNALRDGEAKSESEVISKAKEAMRRKIPGASTLVTGFDKKNHYITERFDFGILLDQVQALHNEKKTSELGSPVTMNFYQDCKWNKVSNVMTEFDESD